MISKEPGLYKAGDRVWINKLFVMGDVTMEVVDLKNPFIATVKEVKERCSEPFGVPYVISLPKHITKKDNCANACYWETDIICKVEDEEDLFWKVWGDQ